MKQDNPNAKKSKVSFSSFVIPAAFVVAVCIFMFVLGDASHFDANGHPLPGDYFGMVYKGGFIVPLLMTLLLITITFSIERFFAIRKSKGKNDIVNFVKQVRAKLSANDIKGALVLCDEQKGSVANIIRSGLIKYQEVEKEDGMSKDQKLLAIQKEIEETTTLEMPALNQNLPVIATISSVATLFALLGTVLGMIRAFAGLANAGAPDSTALATGISEALINTALGIGTAAISVISYSFYTNSIDHITYSIDEAGYSIIQTYAANHK